MAETNPPSNLTAPKTASGWAVELSSADHVTIVRRTAESHVKVGVQWTGYAAPNCRFDVAASISVRGLAPLLDEFSRSAGCGLTVEFLATRLNSSHVVAEDTGMVLGRAIRELFEQRMVKSGANGAGSSIVNPREFHTQPIHVGVSIEGRKFWKFVPFTEGYDDFRKSFLIGQSVGEDLFSEDLDDFIDGLSGGMACSIIIHVRQRIAPHDGWPSIFRGLGQALATALAENPHRRGVPPGVKATLA